MAVNPDMSADDVLVLKSGYGGEAVAFDVHRVQRALVPFPLGKAVLTQLELRVEVVNSGLHRSWIVSD